MLLSGLVLFPLYISSVNAFIPFGALALGVILYTLFHPSIRRQAGGDAGSDDGSDDGLVPAGSRTADAPATGAPGEDGALAAVPSGPVTDL